MLTLFINTASAQGTIALVTENSAIAFAPCTPKTTEQEIVKIIEQLLHSTNHNYKDLTQVACITGPGGFTSLRIGVTVMNTLHIALNIPIAGIHEAELYKARLQTADALWLHSTKKDLVFIQGFGTFAAKYPEPDCANINDVKADCLGTTVTGELVQEHTAILDIHSEQWATLKTMNDVLPELISCSTFHNAPLVPWYGREW